MSGAYNAAVAILLAYLIFITSRGELNKYLDVFI